MDEPTVTISDTTPANNSDLSQFQANFTSTLTTTTGISYRWDFGDGSGYHGPYASNEASHTYAVCGTYNVRVEATDSFGNKTIGSLMVTPSECTSNLLYLPIVFR
jgi:PKD repeat protein